jgi:hypothetical protein
MTNQQRYVEPIVTDTYAGEDLVVGYKEQDASAEPLHETLGSSDEMTESSPQLHTQEVRTRLHNNISKPKKFIDGTNRYSLKKKGFHVSKNQLNLVIMLKLQKMQSGEMPWILSSQHCRKWDLDSGSSTS